MDWLVVAYLDHVLVERVESGAQAAHFAEPLERVNVQLIADEASQVVSDRVDRVHGLPGHLLVNGILEQPAEHAELEQQGAGA